MRALTLQQANVAQGGQQQATCGRSLSSNYAPPSLENKFLAQTSTLTPQPCSLFAAQPCPSLQPSSLSSTSSSLLSSSSLSPSLTSPLLSTENKLLSSHSPALSFSLTTSTSVPNESLLSTSLASSALLNRFAQPPSSFHHALGGEQKRDDRGEEGKEESSEMMLSSSEESVQYSEEDDDLPEDEEDAADGTTMELPVLETELGNQELEQAVVIRQEEFAEIERGNENIEEELKDKKYLLLNVLCCSLVNKSTNPGQKDWDSENSVWTKIMNLAKDISVHDPEFLLKVAVYTRQELNIRITANFLLALAANQPSTKPHVRRYFCAAVQLPSDWLEVVRIYSTCFSRSLPMCLKKAMADKFKQFNEYQLAKYNTRKHRCKHSRNRGKAKKPTGQQLKQWANLLRSDASILEKFLQVEGSKVVVDKKQSEFSIKKMIKKLHIKEPAEHVMAILGRKYPADVKAFTQSGMKGTWDREKAGKRMKLKEPETWERLLSLEGNKAATWEKLIDNKSLPFMAMLRNLRNMITKGISEAHHKKILSRLTNKKAVIQSRQFPFRFLAAYKVIMELNDLASASEQALPPVKEILKDILNKIPKSRRFKRLEWDTAPRSRMRVTLGVPFIYRLYKTKKAQLIKANQKQFTVALLDRYRKALETAVQLSCRYNVPPLPGRTIIVLSSNLRADEDWCKKQDFCLPPDPEQKNDEEDEEEEESGRRRKKKKQEDKLTPSITEIAVLLSLMVVSSAEDSQLCLIDWSHSQEIELKSDVLLDNVRSVIKQIKACSGISHEDRDNRCFSRMLTKKDKVDNIIVLTDYWVNHEVEWAINSYRKEINNKALVVQIFLSQRESEFTPDRNYVKLSGFSEQLLRFVAERGSSRLLDHVEHLDKLYNILPPAGAKGPQSTNDVIPIPASPKLGWRGVRVFVSSTFRDMHAERDILVRSVFPELRRRAASHCLYLQEVELRWGVTEEESERATALCLSEVCRSQMMVAILGERYGLVPPRPVLPNLPQYSWLASAPAALSITEMEIRQFQALYPDAAQQRMFCYFRDPNIIKSVPVAWKSDFVPESKEAESKMASLKRWIRASEVKVTENYSCEWGGVVEGKPYLKNLEDFGRAVLEDLWMAVVKQFVEEDEEAGAVSDVMEQEVHQGSLQRQFFGRAKLLSAAVEMVEQAQTKGGMMVVEGGPGEGKTVFMAALADALRTGVKSRKKLVCDVISYSTAASHSARSVENLLQCLVQGLRKIKDTEEEESPLSHSYKDLLLEFHSKLSDKKKNKPLVLLIDGVDLVQDGKGQLSSEWIPQQLPQGVCLVVSIPTKAALLQILAKKKGTVLFALGQLTMLDRKEIVQKGLDTFGKKLSDSAFNNQLQMLIMKKGAVSPLYLHLACEDLRNFASFDKLKESLQGLPQSLSQLVHYSLDRLCLQYRGMLGLRWALAALTVCTTGLRERDLYSVLNTCNDLSSRDSQVTWQEVLHLSRKPKGRIPLATFTRMVQSLQSLIGSSHCHNTDDMLVLTNPEVKRAFEDFLLPTEHDRTRAHLVLAAHLWTLADPQGTDTFINCEANSVLHLPSKLIQSGQLEALHSLLSSYYFLYANVRHGFLHHLLETYSLYDNMPKSATSFGFQGRLEDCRSFLRRHSPLLSSWPALFIQQALNEPAETSAHTWAQGLVGEGGARVVEWLNNDNQMLQETSELVSTFPSEPTCLVVSSDEELMVVGTGQGILHFINTQTGQEVKSLVSSCDGISSCVFLKDGRLATTSYDGRIEIWDIGNGCRTALIEGHTNVITASDITADRKHLATVSLDFMLKVWSSTKGNEVAALQSSSPLNCVTFEPEGHLLAAGCWNGNVIVWNWVQNKMLTSLSGHQHSVRSLSFSPSSSMLCSGSVSGEVRVWSVPNSTCVGCFQAHGGATEALTFLDEGSMLLSAGSDHMLQLWSGGLGRSVTALKSDKCEREPPPKKLKSVTSEPAALCVAINGDYAAVGYHGDGIKLFSLDSGESIWDSGSLDVSVLCLLWVISDAEELLLSAGSDKRLRVWKRKEEEKGLLGGLEWCGLFGVQTGVVLALAQNSTYLATASDDFTIVLWLLSDVADDRYPTEEPPAMLRGHRGGVTCLAFSPDGGQLLSGGKDQALMVWDVSSSPPALSKSLLLSHRDWITGCVWTSDCVISSSNDGRLCLWDLQAGQCLKEISWRNPLTSVCCLGQYVIAGCAEGGLHVWNWETNTEICHIAAHKQRIHHCSLLPITDKSKENNPEEMTVSTASDDGTVQLWKPLQVEHFGTFQGHSGAICEVVCKEGLQQFLTVSEDCSLRCWTWTTESPPSLRGPVTALCFSQRGDLLLASYESGLLEVWQHHTVVGHKQASDSTVTAICSMPDGQFAVSYTKPAVDVWKLVWNHQHSTASLVKVTTYTVENPVVRLIYCSVLMGVSDIGTIFDVTKDEENNWNYSVTSWSQCVRILGMVRNDEKSMWLVGEEDKEVKLGFVFAMGSKNSFNSAFSQMSLETDEEEKKKGSLITAGTVDKEFVVCGDVDGNMWYNQPSEVSSWSSRKPAHSDRITVLKLTDSTIISASYDRTVKLWDRDTKKQVGMFVCGGPVLHLEVNPEEPNKLVCGDGSGKLYFLSWKE
ncbi:telomerase protein component 1 isoform X1 [Epinephelus moara]|uniref:telomerase protein component 1 isoform X1 n=1 Tax=Epinephelus moara TaxID=300413 RepID=UPI00214EFF9D|nr:telomerase protein component 1 isoform X1 [Epinephelus moara]XP_049888723.1 telomerase protein component 1 isoform X1 [Epinephelus moara]